jgi:hypothetical protein
MKRPLLLAFGCGAGAFLVALLALSLLGGPRSMRPEEAQAPDSSADLAGTTLVLEQFPDGGLKSIVVRDATDQKKIAAVRARLRSEFARLRSGDFSAAGAEPQKLPGQAELEGAFERIDVTYVELPEGAQIRFSTPEAPLVAALHAWFAAQVPTYP